MSFCTGPPRTYAASATWERIEDVVLAMHPSQLVLARVTASDVALWSASPGLLDTGRRLLATCSRGGRWVTQQLEYHHCKNKDATGRIHESKTRQLWAAWVVGHRLAVVEKASHGVEFYAFDGLIQVMQRVATCSSHVTENGTINNLRVDHVALNEPEHETESVHVTAQFIKDVPCNRSTSGSESTDVATAMSAVPGSKFVFVGMASGLIEVVDVTEAFKEPQAAWCPSSQRLVWKIDICRHVADADESDRTSCVDLTCAVPNPVATMTSIYLLAKFATGNCFLLLLSAETRTMDHLLSLVATEHDTLGRQCETIKFDASGYNFALGWSDGSVSLFSVTHQRGNTKALAVASIRDLSLTPWGYTRHDVGAVTALDWSHDGQQLAIGYAVRGFAVFSIDGCRVMSSVPQQQQERPKGKTEVGAFGVLAIVWTHESHALLVVPRGEQQTEQRNDAHCMTLVTATLQPTPEGLGLALSGAPGRCGAWVHSDTRCTPRPMDGTMGPADACGFIHRGDLLVGMQGNDQLVNLPFDQIVHELKAQRPQHEPVTLTLLRLNWPHVFTLALSALSSPEFLTLHGLRLREHDELCIREYALRMQALHGDCDVRLCVAGDARAKVDGWLALRGTPGRVAQHKYVKFAFALFPVWNPMHFLSVLTDFGKTVAARTRDNVNHTKGTEVHEPWQSVTLRDVPLVAFAEYDFATSVPRCGNTSCLVLLERHSIRLVAAPALDDPCTVKSSVHWSVPLAFTKWCPLRLVARSASGNHVAVAGQRGFCLLNVITGKWRMFGNVNDEQDLVVYAFQWLKDDAIMVHFTRASERHQVLHLQAYPRNHLDTSAVLAHLVVPRTGPADAHAAAECFMMMASDHATRNVFCISQQYVWCVTVQQAGTIPQNDVQVTMHLQRHVPLPSRILLQMKQYKKFAILDLAVLPRFAHLQDETQCPKEADESEDAGWLATVVNRLVGGQVPDQYSPAQVWPRFAFLGNNGEVIVWDPETRSQRLVGSNVSTMARLCVSPRTCASWPTPCRLVYGLYGPDGMKLWLPLLDGVYLTRTQAFDNDQRRLETFLACHDPLRAKTYEIEFGTAPATAELYDQVLREYGIELDNFWTNSRTIVSDNSNNLRGCVMTVDDWSAKDQMLRFDVDVKVLGAEPTFGLLVGVSQDVYVPSGVSLPCYDVFARVQPFFHPLLCFLVQNEQLSWAKLVLNGIRHQFALATATQELFLHSMLESCYLEQCTHEKVTTAITLLKVAEEPRDIAEYCEIIAHVARKSEPSRLQLLFPAAGDPMELLEICQQRSELRTAANYLLILDECSTVLGSSLPLRMECAAELLKQCIDQEEWTLAQHVVRVARDWSHPRVASTEDCGTNIEEQLASVVYDNLMRGEYERVVWCVEDLQAKLPLKTREERMVEECTIIGDSTNIVNRLAQTFIQGNKRRQLRILLQAVTEAHYDEWIVRIKHVMEL